jgi:ribose 5-phosphate isomerase B
VAGDAAGTKESGMKVALGCDHGGFALKDAAAAVLRCCGHEIVDVGAFKFDAGDDYPDFALAAAHAVRDGRAERGLLICGSGVGACIAANKVRGVRASVCHDTYSAHQGVEHDDMNILCLGARIVGPALAEELVRAFAEARFSGEERHRRRLEKVKEIENEG